jgi:hypothetical protein
LQQLLDVRIEGFAFADHFELDPYHGVVSTPSIKLAIYDEQVCLRGVAVEVVWRC